MSKFLFGILVVITTALMGSSFAIGKIGLEYSSPLLLVALRFTIADRKSRENECVFVFGTILRDVVGMGSVG